MEVRSFDGPEADDDAAVLPGVPDRDPPQPPTAEDLGAIASSLGLTLSAADLEEFVRLQEPLLSSYARLDVLFRRFVSDAAPASSEQRDPGSPPSPEENRLGAWFWQARIREREAGLLAGKSVAIKDNIAVAGLPMMAGTELLRGFMPTRDATVVARVLAEGGEIEGKTVCESLSSSAGSHTSATGPVRNPFDPSRSAGGSSSGNGVVLASREVDMAIGSDQAGSIRIPASWCGVVGLKPTFGLVPYGGIAPLELTLDHAGPMARTVEDVALLLAAMTGGDQPDLRQDDTGPAGRPVALGGGVSGLRIGVVTEAFRWQASQSDVDDAVREAAHAFQRLGARAAEISVPWHREGLHVYNAICLEGSAALMGDGMGIVTNVKAADQLPFAEAYASGRRTEPDGLPDTFLRGLLLGEYMRRAYSGRYYARARDLGAHLSAAYDDALSRVDLLALPTAPMKATKLPSSIAGLTERVIRGFEMIHNTSPFNVTGHPSISLPCAISEGLPIGMMLVARHGEEALLLRAAATFESDVFAAPEPRLG